MTKRIPRKEDHVPPVTRNEVEDAVQRFLAQGGTVTKLPDAPDLDLHFRKDTGFIVKDGVVNVDWTPFQNLD